MNKKPQPMPVKPEDLPAELTTGNQFILWRWERDSRGKYTKVPYQPSGIKAKSNDPKTWTTFDKAMAAHQSGKFDGVGRCFSPDDPYTAFDLDGCRLRDGSPAPWAAEIMDLLNSYSEITPSGNGFRTWVIGQKPGPRSGRKKPDIKAYQAAGSHGMDAKTVMAVSINLAIEVFHHELNSSVTFDALHER